jgi:hypothetical protein
MLELVRSAQGIVRLRDLRVGERHGRKVHIPRPAGAVIEAIAREYKGLPQSRRFVMEICWG